MADGEPELEMKFRKMPIYDFYFRLATLKKNAQKHDNKLANTAFGFGGR